jgi:putative transposase
MVRCAFGQTYANELRRRRPRCGDKWHLDEVYREHQRKNALSLASSGSGWQRPGYPCTEPTRTAQAAKRFFRKLLKELQYVPRVIITDKLKSYGAAKREILPGVEHRQHKGLNNRAENSHQPTRLREKKMRRLKSARTRTTLSLRGSRPFRAISNRDGIG